MPSRALAAILRDLQTAASLLEAGERGWPDALRSESPDEGSPELARIEELLHCATHETASALALTLQEINVLLQRVRLRRKFAIFSPGQFDRIIREGWSTRLGSELQREIPSMPLPELSTQIKQLCSDWGKLPPTTIADH